MTVTDEGKTLNKLSPFAIHKGIFGGDVTIKRQFSGDICLTCSLKSGSNNLLKFVLFGNIAPIVETHQKELSGIGNFREPILKKLRRMFLVSLTYSIS